ncbi:MAG TPA: S-methyl-5'-thioadenosine phosphorylase [Methylosinus sp.]|jgi:5'-methylthioadenosine phosphorylase|uniref:S-methyl-5'-thioadenosine phosphorylase n=1 Tax=Methylosinus sp. TaxID=427 RepID=UPI002F949D68
MTRAVVGIIGGSGVYHLPGLQDLREERVTTPWGDPSDALHFGRIGETEVVFLPRHGRGHAFSPSGINYRANIYALKQAGVTDLVSVSACGSFKSELYPGLFVLPDQFVDRTFGRQSSFFGNGCVAHVSLAHPVAPLLAKRIAAAAKAESIEHSVGGTYVCMEGPQFSSYAESLTYKAAGYDVIGMTAMPEAKLAREAELSYATIAMVTDFDCWHPEHDNVDVAAVIAVVRDNADKASRLLARLLSDFPQEHEPCPIGSDRALDNAILTAPDARDPELLKKLGVIVARVSGAAA